MQFLKQVCKGTRALSVNTDSPGRSITADTSGQALAELMKVALRWASQVSKLLAPCGPL